MDPPICLLTITSLYAKSNGMFDSHWRQIETEIGNPYQGLEQASPRRPKFEIQKLNRPRGPGPPIPFLPFRDRILPE